MAVLACLNGARSQAEHPGVPQSPAELAADAVAVRRAGAFAVHVHPRDRRGAQTMDARACDAAVSAIRAAVPGMPIGLSTSEVIQADPFARAAAVRSWGQRPDFVSVNLSELGWAGIAVEAGLATAAEAQALADSPFVHQVLRALVEVGGGAEEARAIAQLVPGGTAQLWHGYGGRTWEVLGAAAAAGVDVRVGLEDVVVLPDGTLAANNAELVAAAVTLVAPTGGFPAGS
jgi:uncharacterized protein (DUF849 family)